MFSSPFCLHAIYSKQIYFHSLFQFVGEKMNNHGKCDRYFTSDYRLHVFCVIFIQLLTMKITNNLFTAKKHWCFEGDGSLP